MNAPRNELIRQGNQAHERAELAWRRRGLWDAVLNGLLAIAAIAFIAGVALPLIHTTSGGLLVPPNEVALSGPDTPETPALEDQQ